MKAIKLNKTAQAFLPYASVNGGKYYTTEQGSKSYKNTVYSNFSSRNPQFVNVIETGNDAPRGGQTGNYEIVTFSPEFQEVIKKYEEEVLIENQKQAEIKAQKDYEKANFDKLIVEYSTLIEPKKESFKETASRLGKAIGKEISGSLFYATVKAIRNLNKA
jgi:hypothetical protein